ncbi:hypothetical protein QO003_001745 [Arthrobacter silviterrae]|uniref:Uncharacterized protein n=1 Tax=Arthrobacter silviterrae TaxID=2026658 RepID=A0ABX0DHR9_9MICC|nr:hypothetical protein [Arthrobacter silviterrae]MDQ0277442.1 hypothetical protein [Arthrobacter silviterrae]NGN85296.1 hypothetical protein [Arthrobacter silviterrae]
MTGRIKLHQGIDGVYHVEVVDDHGKTIAATFGFLSEKAALEGVFTLREIAGTANVSLSTIRDTPLITSGPVADTATVLLPRLRLGLRDGDCYTFLSLNRVLDPARIASPTAGREEARANLAPV